MPSRSAVTVVHHLRDDTAGGRDGKVAIGADAVGAWREPAARQADSRQRDFSEGSRHPPPPVTVAVSRAS
ncbi:MAG: hypothetical protein KIS78_28910, partial [Labilithrix sp.]|nr:hypothetical protein [Labilithrix sp.]